jgi:CDP-glucose 4,6-dehydratase
MTDFWKNKKVFLTGHTGFKGSWLSLLLQSLGANVTGYSLLPPSEPNLFETAQVHQGMTTVIGDIRDLDRLSSAVRDAMPDVVIHMAAQSLVKRSYENPVETYSTNVMGTVNLLEVIRNIDTARSVINVTSDKCYENKDRIWPYRENESMGGFDPYSNSKGCSELVTSAYRDSFFSLDSFDSHGVAIATARAGNVIGGGDWALDRLIPDFIRALSRNEIVKIRNPQAIRPWQHVLDPLYGYLILAEKLYLDGNDFAEAWNFGPSNIDSVKVIDIVETFAKCWGEAASFIIESSLSDFHEANILKLDSTKSRSRLGWRSKISTTQAIEKIVSWQKSYLKGEDMHEYSINEILAYSMLG